MATSYLNSEAAICLKNDHVKHRRPIAVDL
ncbi:MAG: hypothetical protein RLZZ574_2231, partial [Cyanobacteriota bacterium]